MFLTRSFETEIIQGMEHNLIKQAQVPQDLFQNRKERVLNHLVSAAQLLIQANLLKEAKVIEQLRLKLGGEPAAVDLFHVEDGQAPEDNQPSATNGTPRHLPMANDMTMAADDQEVTEDLPETSPEELLAQAVLWPNFDGRL